MSLISFVLVVEKLKDVSKQLLNSIYEQVGDVKDSEIIIITRNNDNIDEFQDEIIISNKFNVSTAESFNQGIMRATSNYICFLTGQEMFYKNLINDVKKEISKGAFPDIINIAKISIFNQEKQLIDNFVFEKNYFHKKHQPKLDNIIYPEQLALLSNKIYSRNFLLKQNIRFNNNYISEFVLKAYLKADLIVGLNYGLVEYYLKFHPSQQAIKEALTNYNNFLLSVRSSEFTKVLNSNSLTHPLACLVNSALLSNMYLGSEKFENFQMSVIVPVHNVEEYVKNCLDSIAAQSLKNIQIIVIDDGSTDNSLLRILDFSAAHKNVFVISINKASGHPGTPRNLALCIAKSEFVAFVDSDDWIDPEMLASLYEKARLNNLDICSTSGYYRVSSEIDNHKFNYISKAEGRSWDFLGNKFFSNIWNRIYNLNLLLDKGIYFPSLYLSEDLCFSAISHYYAKNTGSIPGSYYYYRYNLPNSTTEQRTGEKGFLIIDDFEKQLNYLENFSLDERFLIQFLQKQLDSFWYTHDRMDKLLRPLFKAKLRNTLLPFKEKFKYEDLSPDARGRIKSLFSSNESNDLDAYTNGLDLYRLKYGLSLQTSGKKFQALEIYSTINEQRLRYFNCFCVAMSLNNLVQAKVFLNHLKPYPHEYERCCSILSDFVSKKQLCEIENNILPSKNDLLLSVIIPVHNSGKYLRQCLDSVVNQTYKNLEILVINDGSTDESLDIITEFAYSDDRIKIINNQNASGNPGTPRNQAIEIAKGDYLTFVDSDDYIDLNYYRYFMEALEQNGTLVDIVFASGYHDFSDIKAPKKVVYDNQQFNDLLGVFYRYHQSFTIWDKIYKASFIKSNDILLAELPAAVDVPFVLKCYIEACEIISCDNNYGYYYRRESDSSVTKNRRKKSNCEFEFQAYNQVVDWMCNDDRLLFKPIVDFKKISSYLYTLTLVSEDYKDEFYKRVRDEFLTFDRDLMIELFKISNQNEKLARFIKVLNTPRF